LYLLLNIIVLYLSFFFSWFRCPLSSALFPYTTLFRSSIGKHEYLSLGTNLDLGQDLDRAIALTHGGIGPLEDERMRDRQLVDRSDRKSTRLNSSHVAISYAVFCLKKKSQQTSKCFDSS